MVRITLLVVIAASSIFTSAEVDPVLRLQVLERVTVSNQFARILEGPFRCDGDGSVFVSPYEGGGFSTNLIKIQDKGHRVIRFPAALPPEVEKGGIADFAIGRNNEVYLLMGNGKGEMFILSFDKDGKLGSTAKLDLGENKDIGPSRLAAFDNGDFLVYGRKIENHQLGGPFIGIYNDRGQLQKTINPKGDVKADSPEVAKLANQEQGDLDGYALALASMAERGDDGNIYLARGTATGPLFVISPSGTVLRTIRFNPPSNDARFSGFKVAGGRIVVEFVESNPKSTETAAVTMIVLETQSGKEVGRYFHKSAEIGAAFACYLPPDEFVFVGADNDGKLQLVRASGPR